jgi:hypothetical protein
MGQLESLRELSIEQSDQKRKEKKKKKKKKKKKNKALAIMPWLNLMGILVNFEILSYYTLELI